MNRICRRNAKGLLRTSVALNPQSRGIRTVRLVASVFICSSPLRSRPTGTPTSSISIFQRHTPTFIMFALMLLFLPLCSAVIYETVTDLPAAKFDYIIVGGTYSLDICPAHGFRFSLQGGAAGNVLANRLTEDPQTSVLVLEAGRSYVTPSLFEIHPSTQPRTADLLTSQIPFFCTSRPPIVNWNFTTTPQPSLNNRDFGYSRGFGLGGSSAISKFDSVIEVNWRLVSCCRRDDIHTRFV